MKDTVDLEVQADAGDQGAVPPPPVPVREDPAPQPVTPL